MKVGFIVECGPQGPETQVIPLLAQQIVAGIEPDVVPMDNKRVLKSECGRWVRALLKRGCARVLIIWDLLPDWDEYEGRGCRHNDKKEIWQSLQDAGISRIDRRVRLVCIEKMLEAWFLADHHALCAVLSTNARTATVPRCNNAEHQRNPKLALNRIFGLHGHRFHRYEDRTHAILIARAIVTNLNRVRRCQTFCRFEDKLR